MRVVIGFDAAEKQAAAVAAKTLYEVSRLEAEFLVSDKLRSQGLLTRLEDTRQNRYDLTSNAPCSTEFSASRFLTPLLGTGYALFTDCDVVFYENPIRMLAEVEEGRAVYVVKHKHIPTDKWKMVGQAQTTYPRKNWSSVMLFNCDHPANQRLSVRDVNERPGRDLHAFYWLHDDEIGDLHPRWNWLVGVEEKPSPVGIAHFTLGGPFNSGWSGSDYDHLWLEAAQTGK